MASEPRAVSDEKLSAVFGDLRAMAGRKVCATATACVAHAAKAP